MQIVQFVQYLMKVVPTTMVAHVVALAKVAIPLPTTKEQLTTWRSGLSVTGPLGDIVGDVGEMIFAPNVVPTPTPNPEPVLGTEHPCPKPCPGPGPCPCSDVELSRLLTGEIDPDKTMKLGGFVDLALWVELIKVLWTVSEPVLTQIIAWIKARFPVKE